MFQSAISCKDYYYFVEVCKESEEKAIQLKCKYTNTTQDMLQETINAIWHGGQLPQLSFTELECKLQDKIARGDFKKTLDEGHHKIGHF